MKQYLDLMKYIRDEGVKKEDRTGTGTISVFGYQMRFDLAEIFPLLTTKKVNLDSIIHELLWFISGNTNISYLVKNGVNIWNDWPYQSYLKQTNQEKSYPMHSKEWKEKMKEFIEQVKNDDDFAKVYGDLGPVYGHQWRFFNAEYKDCNTDYTGQGIDQLKYIIDSLKNPETRYSRRLILSAWNPCQIDEMALPPCHVLMQFNVIGNKLSCSLYQRSGDVGLGVPFNIASYSFLTHIIAHYCGLDAHEFVYNLGNAHIYDDHLEALARQCELEPYKFPTLTISDREYSGIEDYCEKDIVLNNYTMS